ncbi:unnamed protein product, partial [Prorocentrum cordatum]
AGFAAIFSGTSLMRVCVDPKNKAWSKIVVWLPIVFNQLVVQAAFKVSAIVRQRQVQARWEQIKGRRSNSEEETRREQEGLQMVEDLMKEEVVEGENDASSLSMSYLAVHVMRFSLTGYLPDEKASSEFPGRVLAVNSDAVARMACLPGAAMAALVLGKP